MFNEIHRELRSMLSCVQHQTGMPAAQLTMSDIVLVDKQLAEFAMARVRYLLRLSDAPESIVAKVKSIPKTEMSPSIGAWLEKTALAQGELLPQPSVLMSSSELSAKYRKVVPFLLAGIFGKQAKQVGFYSPQHGNAWFSVFSQDQQSIDCIGYQGEARRISLSGLRNKGYSPIEGSPSELAVKCRADAGNGVSGQEVKAIALFLGAVTLPGFYRNMGERKLESLLSLLPGNAKPKPARSVGPAKI